MSNPTVLLFVCGTALAALIWVAAAVSTHPKVLGDLQAWARLAFLAGCAQPIAVAMLSARQQSIIGASSTPTSAASLAGEFCNVLLVIALFVIVVQRRRSGARTGGVLIALWGLAVARLISDALATQHALPKDTLVIAAVASALHLANVDRATFVGWVRLVVRLVLGASLLSWVIAPSWAMIGEGANGYDRTLFGLPRLSGLAPHPTALSLIAVLAIVIEVGCPSDRRRWRNAGLAAATGCLLLAQSNTGYIATFIALLVLAAVRHRAVRILGYSSFAGLVATLVAFPSLQQFDWTFGSSYIATVSGRTPIWQLAVDEFHRHPWAGYGPTFLGPGYRNVFVPESLQYASEGHNQFFQTLGENGLLGVAVVAFLAVASLVVGWRLRHVDQGVAMALVTAAFVNSVTNTPIYPSGIIGAPLIIFGILVTRPLTPEREGDESDGDLADIPASTSIDELAPAAHMRPR